MFNSRNKTIKLFIYTKLTKKIHQFFFFPCIQKKKEKKNIFFLMSEATVPPQEQQQVPEQAPEVQQPQPTGPTEPFSIYPLNQMNQNLQYQVMFQPVYVSPEDPKIYFAGPLLAKLPETGEKGFLTSLTETLNIAEKKVSTTVSPFFDKITQKTNQAADTVQNKFNTMVQNFKAKRAAKQAAKQAAAQTPAATPAPAPEAPKSEDTQLLLDTTN